MNKTQHTAFSAEDRKAIENSGISASLASNPQMNFDAAEDASVYFARELDFVKVKTYDKVFPELTALKMFPVTHEVPEGAESVTYYGYEPTGLAKIIGNYATDLPRADVKGQPKTALVKGLGASYGYSVQDMRASKLAGKGLDAKKGFCGKICGGTLNQLDCMEGRQGKQSGGYSVRKQRYSAVFPAKRRIEQSGLEK